MRRRESETLVSRTELPAYLASGPCVEDWAEPGARMPQWSALRAWQHAVDAWARSAGLTGPELATVQNRARCRTAWSREWLIADGRTELADWYDGKRATPPEHTGWRPRVGPSDADPAS